MSLDRASPPEHNYRSELPSLEVLRVHMTLGSDDRVDTSINMICRKLKLLDLRYTLELDIKNAHKQPAIWMELGEVDGVEELQIDLAIHEVTEVGSMEKLRRVEQREQRRGQWEQQREQRLEQWEQRLEQQLEQWERRLELELEALEQEDKMPKWEWRWDREERVERREWREQQVQYLLFTKSICTHWREWLNLPNSLTHVQQSSLKVTLSTRIHQGTSRVMRNLVEELLVWNLPQLTELTTFMVLPIFPKHLQKLRFHGLDVSDSSPPITLPSLVSLEIVADSPDHLRIMTYIQMPQLRVLRVQIEDGPGTLHQHDWRHTTNNQMDHISLSIEIPRNKRGNHILVFHLPQTQSLHVSSPHIPLHLHLAKPVPLLYTLNASFGIMSGPSDGQVGTLSAIWNGRLETKWVNPLLYIRNAGLGTVSGPSDGQVRTLSPMWNEKWVTVTEREIEGFL